LAHRWAEQHNSLVTALYAPMPADLMVVRPGLGSGDWAWLLQWPAAEADVVQAGQVLAKPGWRRNCST
jgi:hypothetical protein